MPSDRCHRYWPYSRAISSGPGSRPSTALKVAVPTCGSVSPAELCSPMSADTPWSRSKAHAQLRAPDPPVCTRVSSMSNSTVIGRAMPLVLLARSSRVPPRSDGPLLVVPAELLTHRGQRLVGELIELA